MKFMPSCLDRVDRVAFMGSVAVAYTAERNRILKGRIEIITDNNGKKLVRINDIRFKGKRSVDWNDVKAYLEEYVGQFYQIASSEDIIYIGNKLPDEYTGSKYTHGLKGTAAKAKANAAQGRQTLPDL